METSDFNRKHYNCQNCGHKSLARPYLPQFLIKLCIKCYNLLREQEAESIIAKRENLQLDKILETI